MRDGDFAGGAIRAVRRHRRRAHAAEPDRPRARSRAAVFSDEAGPKPPAGRRRRLDTTGEMRNWLSWGAIRIINYKGLHIVSDRGAIMTMVVVEPGVSRRSFRLHEPAHE